VENDRPIVVTIDGHDIAQLLENGKSRAHNGTPLTT
jgi:hypothetical protein